MESKDRVLKIETYQSYQSSICFAGTLRNERKFELFQDVFILHNQKMYACKIVGVELPPKDNADYIYKVELPKEFIDPKEQRQSLICQHIFSSIKEAKNSATKEVESKYKLNIDFINKFFKQYEKL